MIITKNNYVDKDDFPTFSNIISITTTGQMTSQYQSITGEIFYEESIGRVDMTRLARRTKIDRKIAKHEASVKQTLNQITELGMSEIDAIALEVFQECRNNLRRIKDETRAIKQTVDLALEKMPIYGKYYFRGYQKVLLFTVAITAQGTDLFAVGISRTGELFYQEEIGTIDERETAPKKHLEQINTILHKTGTFTVEAFLECRKKFREEKQLVEDVKRFVHLIGQRMKNDYHIRANVEKTEEYVESAWTPYTANGIRDHEIPLEASLVRLMLVNRYSDIRYPTLRDLVNTFNEARSLRLKVINSVQDYVLIYDDKLILTKEQGELSIYDEDLLRELCTPITTRPWLRIIDEAYIINAKKYVSEKNQLNRLRKFKGLSIEDAIEVESGAYGNVKRNKAIQHAEVDALDSLDQFLFESIYYMCYPQYAENRSFSKQDWKTWNQLKERYHYLAGNEGLSEEQIYWREKYPNIIRKNHKEPGWLKLKAIFKCLTGHNTKLNIRPELLRIIKMFDLAISQINCMQRGKIEIDSYSLRKRLLEITPNFYSYEVFSRTLFHERLSKVEYLANSDNWVDERVGQHARLLANTCILAKSLSERVITGARGNTAAGKSTALGHHKGILNVDSIKWGLRKGTEIRNSQVHHEGGMIFNHCFDEIAKSNLNYIVDLRLIELKSVIKFLVDPAKQRNSKVTLSDFDVPLLTTLNRVLDREPRAEDPIPALQPMVSGFEGIREHRMAVLEAVEKEELIEEYNLYYLGKIVAKKEEGKIIILDPIGYAECLRKPSKEELESCLNRVIDDEYIREALERGDLRSNTLERWKGKKVREALEIHGRC